MTLTEEIKKKFGNVSRGAIIINVPHTQIVDAERYNRPDKKKEILKLIRSTPDRPIEGEVTPELRKYIASLWKPEYKKAFKEEGFPYHWIDALMNGKRRMFVTGKVKRLIKRMEE